MKLCSLPGIYLGPNFGGGNEDNGELLQNIPCIYCYTHCLQPCSKTAPTHASAGDSWTLLGKSGPVSYGVTAPFSWVLVHKVLFVPSKSLFPPSCVSSGRAMVGLMVPSSKRLMPYSSLLHTQPLPLKQSTADPDLFRRHPNTVLSQSLWGPWVLVHSRFV